MSGKGVRNKVTEIEIRVVAEGPFFYIYERPYFRGGLHRMNKTVDDYWVWSLPPIIDPKEDNHTEIVRLTFSPVLGRSFLHYSNVTKTFWIEKSSTIEFPVNITVTIDITAYDVEAIPFLEEGKQIFKRNATYEFTLEVLPRINTVKVPLPEARYGTPTLSMILKSINNAGLVKCKFTEPILRINETENRWPDDSVL